MNRQDLANRLFGSSRAETAQTLTDGQTLTYTTTAAADSVDGSVLVSPFGEFITDDDSPYVEVATTTQVSAGDIVYVTLYGDTVGKHMIVTGVAGKGDALADSISNIQVGGTNLLVESNVIQTWINPSTGAINNPSAAVSDASNNSDASTKEPIPVEADADYALSLYDNRPDAGTQTGRVAWYDSTGTFIECSDDYGWAVPTSQVFHSPVNAAYARVGVIAFPKYRWKFEKGNQPTDYSPAPEDTEEAIAEINKFVTPATEWMDFVSEGDQRGLTIGNSQNDANTHITSDRVEINAGGQAQLSASADGLSTKKIVMGNTSGQFAWMFDEQTNCLYLKKVM